MHGSIVQTNRDYINNQWRLFYYIDACLVKKGKVFSGQEPPSGESTLTECGVNYQLLAVITEEAQREIPSCSRPQLATDNGVRDIWSNWLVAPPTLMNSTPWAPPA